MGIILRPMEGNILPPPNEVIVLDTSVIIEIWGTSKNKKKFNKKLCRDFLIKTAVAGNILCITTKTFEELSIIAESNIVPGDKSIFNLNKPLYLGQANSTTNSMISSLNNLPNFYPEPIGRVDGETVKTIQANQITHGLKWGDATIYTLTKQEGINNICSLDGDWLDVQDSNMTLYTTQYRINKYNNK